MGPGSGVGSDSARGEGLTQVRALHALLRDVDGSLGTVGG